MQEKKEVIPLVGHGTETLGMQCRGLEICVFIPCCLELLCENLLVSVN